MPKKTVTQIQAPPKNIFTIYGLSLAMLRIALDGRHWFPLRHRSTPSNSICNEVAFL